MIKHILILLTITFSHSLEITIESRLINKQDNPIAGANVYTLNTETTSNSNGFFRIICDSTEAVTISHINYKSVEITANNIPKVIYLEYSTTTYDEIIIHGNLDKKISPNINILKNELELSTNNHFEELITSISNLNYAGGTSRARYIQIRGLGELSQFSGEGPPHFYVGYIMDDIDFSGIGIGLLNDVKQIEVFKGPQTSIYGPNSMAGLINIISNDPNKKKELIIKSSLSNYNGSSFNLILSSPLSKNINSRLAYIKSNSDGIIQNIYRSINNSNSRDESLTRLKLTYSSNEYFKIRFTSYYINSNNGYDKWTPDNNGFITYTDYQGKDKQRTYANSLKATYHFKDFLLTAISTYSKHGIIYSYDADWANDEYWESEPYNFDAYSEGYRWSFNDSTNRERVSKSQEIRISKYQYSSIFTSGVYMSTIEEKDHRNGWIFSGIADNINSKFEINNYALYFQLQHFFTNQFILTLTTRYDYNQTIYNLNYSLFNWYTYNNDYYHLPEASVVDNNLIGGSLKFDYKLNRNTNLISSFSRGYKTSGINQSPNFENNQFYGTEYSNNIDIGLFYDKNELHIDFTVFYISRTNPQLRLFTQFDINNPTSFDYATFNVESGYNSGFETSIRINPDTLTTLYANIGILNTYISNFSFLGNEYGGRETAHSPRYNGNIGISLNLSKYLNNFSFNTDMKFMGKFYFDDQNEHQSKPYNVINASLTYQNNRIKVSFWGKNIFNTKYAIRGYTFALDPTYETKNWESFGDKRTFGISVDCEI